MKDLVYKQLSEYFDLSQYQHAIINLEQTVHKLNLEPTLLDNVLFWNHYLSLVQRSQEDTLNDIEFEKAKEISDTAYELAQLFVDHHPQLKDALLPEFEVYLLAIYFEKERKEVEA